MDFDEAIERTGWNDQSQTQVLLDFIEKYRMSEALSDYLEDRVKQEEEG